MDISTYFIKRPTLFWSLMAIIVLGGIYCYIKMPKLEDPAVGVKEAIVVTQFPGASAHEVELQVTSVLENELRTLPEVKKITSESSDGMSKINVTLEDNVFQDIIQQRWDLLRRKVESAATRLPHGCAAPIVMDDVADVYGMFYAVTTTEYDYPDMWKWTDYIKRELLAVPGVRRIEIKGDPQQCIDIMLTKGQIARNGYLPTMIMSGIKSATSAVPAGSYQTMDQEVSYRVGGKVETEGEIENLLLKTIDKQQIRLGDIAEVKRTISEPQTGGIWVNNKPALGLMITTEDDVNVVNVGDAVEERLAELKKDIPAGFDIEKIYFQPKLVKAATNGFMVNLVESVLIVILVLMFTMGLRPSLIIGAGLILTIAASFPFLLCFGTTMQRISLGAFIVAMGMLVDNAIVVSDSALVNMQRGMRKRVAIMRACSSTALPLLAATIIAILTFLPIYYSPHITGELLSSLVVVIGVSLMFSWVFALTQTPFFIQEFVRRPRPEELKAALFDGKYYNRFRNSLHWVLCHRSVTIGSLVVMLILSAWSFKFIPKVFVPALDKQYFTVDMWLPEGTNINETDRMASNLANYIRGHEETEMVSTYIGRTPPRYYLSNVAFGPQSNYAQILVKCKTSQESRKLHALLQDSIRQKYPEPLIKVNKFELSPLTEAVIEARFLGPDPAVLDSLTGKAIEIMRRNPKVADARNEWGNMSLMIRPVYDPVKAGVLGITKAQMMQSVKSVSDGTPIGIYRDNEKKVPVLLKSEGVHITDVQSLGDFPVWNGEHSAPLSQVTEKIETTWEFPQIRTYNRQLSMAAMCGVKPGHTMAEVHGEIREEIEAIELPEGYSFFWDAQYKDQGEAMQAIAKFFPLAFLMLVVILVALFGNFRQPIIILCILPLSLIGVAVGMLLTGFDFGFFPIAGWLGLLGMIIKNVIVLLDEINIQRRNGVAPYTAVVEATVSRTRPVLMAATTTILGMVPLLFDIAFGGMAATIIFGLTFATLLTLFITPTLYAMFYKIK